MHALLEVLHIQRIQRGIEQGIRIGLEVLAAGGAGPAPEIPSGRPVTTGSVPTAHRARRLAYTPDLNGRADPGEIVWTWVAYEDDPGQGKDRPVLIIGRDAGWLLGLQVTSQDHDRDAAQEASVGRYWMDIGTGGWDRQGRPSEVRLNRIIRIDPSGVRRIGARLPRDRYAEVARGVLAHY